MTDAMEIIPCKVPVSKACGVYLPKINSTTDLTELWREVYNKFSQFGLIYKVNVLQSKYGNCYYGYVRYYSCHSTRSALLQSGKLKINQQNIKISKVTKEMYIGKNGLVLSPQLSEELLSYYFGFNAWNSQIIYLDKDKPSEPNSVQFSCLALITTSDGLCSEGIGVGKIDITNDGLPCRAKAFMSARKLAVYQAMSHAFSKFLIIVLPNGKRMLEVDTTIPDPLYIASDLELLEVKNVEDLSEEPLSEEDNEENEWVENLSDSVLDRLLASTPEEHGIHP